MKTLLTYIECPRWSVFSVEHDILRIPPQLLYSILQKAVELLTPKRNQVGLIGPGWF